MATDDPAALRKRIAALEVERDALHELLDAEVRRRRQAEARAAG